MNKSPLIQEVNGDAVSEEISEPKEEMSKDLLELEERRKSVCFLM